MTRLRQLGRVAWGELLRARDAFLDHWLGYVFAIVFAGAASAAITTQVVTTIEQSPPPAPSEIRLLLEEIRDELHKCLDSRYDRPCRDNELLLDLEKRMERQELDW